MCYKSLLLLLSVCMLSQVGGYEKCHSTNVTLQLQVMKSRVEGRFEVHCEGAEPMPLCAEVMSRRLIQNMTCSALGLQYSEYMYKKEKEHVECYSMQYQLNTTKGRQAAVACDMTTENSQWNNRSLVLFHSLIQSNNTTLMQPVQIEVSAYQNETAMCPIVLANVNVLSGEEREQLSVLLPRKSHSSAANCSITVTNLTARSFTQVVTNTRVPASDIKKASPVCTTVASNATERIAVLFLLILLISLIIVLVTVLVYVGYCRKKYRLHRILRAERAQAMLLSNNYTDSLATAKYVQIEESMATSCAGGAHNQSRDEASETGEDHSMEVHYDEVNNCGRKRRQVLDGYSYLNHK